MIGSGEICIESAADARRTRTCQDARTAGFLRGLVEGMRCGIVAIDRAGRLVMVNHVATQVLGLVATPVAGLPIDRALADHPGLARVLGASFEMTSLPNRAELDLALPDGTRRMIGFTLSLVRLEGEREPLGAAMFFKDLTQIEHKEEQERLRDRLAALGEMAASLAHEIRNPLAAIDVTCALLRRRLETAATDDPAGRELLAKITGEVRRLNRTVTSALEHVRPLSLDLGYAKLPALLDEAVAVAAGRAGRPGIRVERRYEQAMPSMLMDRRQLRQVFENLVLNAMEAMGESGTVTVVAETREAPAASTIPYPACEERPGDPWQRYERFAVVRVADQGPGILEEDRARVFYPFFTTKPHGSGVGLSTVKKIVNSHRGLIDVDEAPGGGALFTVRLPLVVEPTGVEAP